MGAEEQRRLDEYRRKRRPDRTPEPFGGARGGGRPRFVVQRHSARRLHYDLRLEREGVLASWAVPKGLPTEAGSRRRAVHTEDHPLEYLEFEGEIPKGEYGGGTIDVYDGGPYELLSERPDGGLTFRLDGERLRGAWTLVPARLEGEERNWLLLKREEGARVTRRERYLPMLATLTDGVPARGDWLHEVKWDGYRVVARLAEGEARLWSRRGQDFTERFAAIAKDLGRGLKTFDCVVDGEICALDGAGRPSFQLLQQGIGTLVYFLFDLLELEGDQLLARPLRERRRLLEDVVDPRTAPVRLSETFPDGEALLEVVREQGLEGVVAKRADSRYAAGTRSRDWLKVKTRLSQEFLVAGFVRGEGVRKRLGSLVLAQRGEDGELRYAGNVGSGFTEREIDGVLARLEPLHRTTTPFPRVPDDPRLRRKGNVVWAEPRLVADVEFTEWTDDGRVRAPVYKGLRDDARPVEEEVRRGARFVRLTRLDQAWWPELGIVKTDVVDYYRRIAPVLLPHLRDRPFTMKRHYNGPRSPFEWVKDAPPELPEWIPVSPQPARSRGGELVRYPLVNDELALLWMVEFGCVDLHVWTSRSDRPDRPDVVLFDLDPAGVPFPDVARAALLLRAALDALGLQSHPMTTGGEGMHVRVPVARRHTYEEVRELADVVAGALVRTSEGLVTTERSFERRHGVFLDTKMNGHGQQVVAPYSLRPLPEAAVAAPLHWDEVDERLDPAVLGLRAVLERVERDGDLAQALLHGRQRLAPALARLG